MAVNGSEVTVNKLYEAQSCSSSQIHNALFIEASYLGIFGNVLINLLIFIVFVTLFAVIRDKTEICGILRLDRKDSKKKPVVPNDEEKVTDIQKAKPKENENEDAYGQEINQNVDFQEIDLENGNHLRTDATFKESCCRFFRNVKHFFEEFWLWVRAIFLVSDDDIRKLSGPDAVYYLSFQRYIIAFCSVLTIVSLVIVFPVNFLGNSEKDYTYFGFGTINNLDPNSNLIWVHVILSIALFPFGILLMRKYSVKLQFEKYPRVSKTLMVVDIPKAKCNKNLLVRQFQEAYPDCVIEAIELACNFSKLISLDNARRVANDAIFYLEESKRNPVLYQYAFCQTAPCCCCCQKKDAMEYYTQKAKFLTTAQDNEELKLKEKPLRIAFITFRTSEMAYRIYKANEEKCVCRKQVTANPKPYLGRVKNAPLYDDIYWENLSDGSVFYFLLAALVNFILFAFFFLWTTPLNILNSHIVSNFVTSVNDQHPMVGSFLSTLLMWNFVSRMPIFVNLFEHFVFHWTRSKANNVILFKTLWIQLFMLIILPTLEFNNTWAFLMWLFTGEDRDDHLHCIYLANSFGFYLNYVITSAIAGSAMDLIRPSQLMRNIFKLSATASEAERYAVRQTFQTYFHFGVQYAWFLPVFAVTVIYSISCPILAPFGLLYMCLQHGVDRHNLVFVHQESKTTKNVHAGAINFVILSILLSQLSLSYFIYLQRGAVAITIFAFVVFSLTALVFIGQFFLNSFQWSSPIITCFTKDDEKDENPFPVMLDPNTPPFTKYLPKALFRQRGNNPDPYWLNYETAGEDTGVRQRRSDLETKFGENLNSGNGIRENEVGPSFSNNANELANEDPAAQNQPIGEKRLSARSFRQGYESLGKVFTIHI